MATRVIDDSKLNAIAVAIQSKDNGGQMTVDEMPGRIEAIPTGSPTVLNPALVLWDWEGTKLAEYSAEDALTLTELPAPSTLPAYATADHDLLLFQSWNWSLANIKTWIQNHEGETRDVGAIYTTTDEQNHNYWGNPRLSGAATVNIHKHGTASIGNSAFQNCRSLTQINIPDGVTSIGNSAFQNCYSLTAINIPNGVTSIGSNAFQRCYSLTAINIPNGVTSIGSNTFNDCFSLTSINIPDGVASISGNTFYNCYSLTSINIPDGVASIGSNAFLDCYSLTSINIPDGVASIGSSVFRDCRELYDVVIHGKPALLNTNAFDGTPSTQKLYVHRSDLSWYETETNWSTIYAQGKIVAAADHLEHLISIGIDVTDFENEVISE